VFVRLTVALTQMTAEIQAWLDDPKWSDRNSDEPVLRNALASWIRGVPSLAPEACVKSYGAALQILQRDSKSVRCLEHSNVRGRFELPANEHKDFKITGWKRPITPENDMANKKGQKRKVVEPVAARFNDIHHDFLDCGCHAKEAVMELINWKLVPLREGQRTEFVGDMFLTPRRRLFMAQALESHGGLEPTDFFEIGHDRTVSKIKNHNIRRLKGQIARLQRQLEILEKEQRKSEERI
jgi:hypothetical protein